MPTDNEYYNRAYFWFDPWRYCNYCQTCQDGKAARGNRSSDDYKSGYERVYGRAVSYDERPEESETVEAAQAKPEPEEHRPLEEAAPKPKDPIQKKSQPVEPSPKIGARPAKQKHVHEFIGSVKLADFEQDVHNHRIAGITGEAVSIPGGHVHKIWTRTDFFDHFHYIQELSGPAIYLEQPGDADPDDRSDPSEKPHVHFVSGLTSIVDGHSHEFQFATLMDAPLLPEEEKA